LEVVVRGAHESTASDCLEATRLPVSLEASPLGMVGHLRTHAHGAFGKWSGPSGAGVGGRSCGSGGEIDDAGPSSAAGAMPDSLCGVRVRSAMPACGIVVVRVLHGADAAGVRQDARRHPVRVLALGAHSLLLWLLGGQPVGTGETRRVCAEEARRQAKHIRCKKGLAF